VVAGGIVYVGSDNNSLYAFNAANGAAIPGFPAATGGAIMSSPAVANGVVYIGSGDGKLYAFNAANGAAVAGFPVTLMGEVNSAPAIGNGYVYVGDESNRIYAINAATGAIAWQYLFPSNYGAEGVDICSPSIADDKLFMTTDQGNGIWVFQMQNPVTPTRTPTATRTPVYTPTLTITGTPPTVTITPTFTDSPVVTATFTATATGTPYQAGNIIAFPNPFNPDKTGNGAMKFINLPIGSNLTIYTLSGEFVTSMRAETPEVWWDGKNAYHCRASPGVYYYLVRWIDSSETRAGKIFVVH
jgi:hypothetical protein